MNEENQLIVIALDKWGKIPETLELVEIVLKLEEENKRLQSSLDYANRDREDMHNKIIELWNKRESQKNMNYKLREQNKNLKDVWHIKKITELKKELNILKLRVEHNDAIIDELLVAEEWTDIQWILEKEYDFSYFN